MDPFVLTSLITSAASLAVSVLTHIRYSKCGCCELETKDEIASNRSGSPNMIVSDSEDQDQDQDHNRDKDHRRVSFSKSKKRSPRGSPRGSPNLSRKSIEKQPLIS